MLSAILPKSCVVASAFCTVLRKLRDSLLHPFAGSQVSVLGLEAVRVCLYMGTVPALRARSRSQGDL
jgi:hypothetical protein